MSQLNYVRYSKPQEIIEDPHAQCKTNSRILGIPLRCSGLADTYSARVVQTESDWEAISEQWDRLVDSMPLASCFLSFTFLYTWWQHFGLSRELVIITLYKADQLIGIAPMMIAPKRIMGVKRRRLEFIGDEINMESPDLIVDKSNTAIRGLLWRCVLSTDAMWDAAYFREQRTGEGTHAVSGMVDSSRYIVAMTEFSESPCVKFDKSWDEYLRTRSRSQRKSFGRKRRQLDKAGTWRFDNYESDCTSLGCLKDYREIESRSWKSEAKLGVGGNPARSDFYRDLFKQLDLQGKARFRFLILDDKPIAATFGVFQHGHFASLEICHDSSFDHLSPGFVLTGLELEFCHESEQYKEYDFLLGNHNNKSTWMTSVHRANTIYILPKNILGHANNYLLFSFKPWFKGVLARYELLETFEDLISDIQSRFR